MEMPTGTIKKLVSDRGFGFIAAEDGKEFFFHRSAPGANSNTLQVGRRVRSRTVGNFSPPAGHRGRLRQPAGWREGFVRDRGEPQGPARQERPHSVKRDQIEPRSNPGLDRKST